MGVVGGPSRWNVSHRIHIQDSDILIFEILHVPNTEIGILEGVYSVNREGFILVT